MLKAVVFDVDETLIDSVDPNARAWVDAPRDRSHEMAFEGVCGQIGKGGDQLMPVFLGKEELEEVGYGPEEHRGRISEECYLLDAVAFPGVCALFERLRADGVRPEDVLVVGNTPYDAAAAGEAGLRTVGLLCGGFPEQDLRDAGCITVHRSPADLLTQHDQSSLVRNGAAS